MVEIHTAVPWNNYAGRPQWWIPCCWYPGRETASCRCWSHPWWSLSERSYARPSSWDPSQGTGTSLLERVLPTWTSMNDRISQRINTPVSPSPDHQNTVPIKLLLLVTPLRKPLGCTRCPSICLSHTSSVYWTCRYIIVLMWRLTSGVPHCDVGQLAATGLLCQPVYIVREDHYHLGHHTC